ncbi:MAG: hypothetical protein KAZ38_18030 [Caldilineaceae bacterium]|nr:hypothetical protein [Caldilineaceae bacterium]
MSKKGGDVVAAGRAVSFVEMERFFDAGSVPVCGHFVEERIFQPSAKAAVSAGSFDDASTVEP